MARTPLNADGRRVTLADLAARLGLDKSSVSLALRGSRKIGAATRSQVVAAARQWGYRPNLAARQLATEAPQCVAMVLSASFAPLDFGVVATTVRSLARQAASAGVAFGVLSCDDLVKAIEGNWQLPLYPDGVLIGGDVPAHAATVIEAAMRAAVVVDPHDLSYASYPGMTISVDNADGSRQITEHLVAQGVRHLLFVLGSGDHLGHQRRWAAARQAWLLDHPLETLWFCHKGELTDSFLQDFTGKAGAAIFCSNDLCALEVWHHLQLLSVPVPGQVLLAGFDAEVSSTLIGLTSARYDGETLGRKAFEMLMGQLKGDKSAERQVLVPVEICIGRTTERAMAPAVHGLPKTAGS
jgi:DNA-binding LacI/PurR family transcriptional regulator